MEFFEKAHVNSAAKTSKNKVKKHLKQMIHAYKHNDKELINKSADILDDFDESTSVSGFSDLNLTDYSSEGDLTTNKLCTSVTSFDDEHFSLAKNLKEDDHDVRAQLSKIEEDSREFSEGSVSPLLSPDNKDTHIILESEIEQDSLSSNFSNMFSVDSLDTSKSDSECSESFDPDGALASKIIQNLKLDGKRKVLKKKKRKIDYEEPAVLLSTTKKRKSSKKKNKSSIKVLSEMNTLLDKTYCTKFASEDNFTDSKKCDNSLQSPPYESVVSSDILDNSLSDILGDYKHPTIRNLCIENSENLDSFVQSSSLGSISINETENVLESIGSDGQSESKEENSTDLSLPEDSTVPNEESTSAYDTVVSDVTENESESEDQNPIGNVRVYYAKDRCILVMKPKATIYFHGKVKATCLGGTVECYGYTMKDYPCEVYAPNYNFALTFKVIETQNTYYGLFSKLTASGLTIIEAEEIVTTLGEHDGVISLKPLKSYRTDFIENNFGVMDMFKINKNTDACFKKASEMLGCSLYMSRPWRIFEENAAWKQALKYGSMPQSKGIFCGGKGSGKSTSLRYYVNKLVSKGPVLVIDLDPGQCEFTVAGNISATVVTNPIIGPSFTHLRSSDWKLNVGMINTMENPIRYATAIENLITYCVNNSRFREMPWIVNTMGMVNAMGLKFITFIVLLIKPTFLMQLDCKNAKKRFEFDLDSNTIRKLYFDNYERNYMFRNITDVDNFDYSFVISQTTDGSARRNFSLAPRDERYLNFIAYFGQLACSKQQSLLAITPYEVKLQDIAVGMNVIVNENSIPRVLNGKIVALCEQDPSCKEKTKVFKLHNLPLRCHGHGLVRGIDENGTLYILTPIPSNLLSVVDTLVYTDWTPELRGHEKSLPAGTTIPYRTSGQYHQRQLMNPPRRRFNPLQLLKLSRNT